MGRVWGEDGKPCTCLDGVTSPLLWEMGRVWGRVGRVWGRVGSHVLLWGNYRGERRWHVCTCMWGGRVGECVYVMWWYHVDLM